MSHEPSDQEVDAFVQSHPQGGNFADIAECLGVTHQRAQQLVAKAVAKVRRELRWRQIYSCRDVCGDGHGGPTWRVD
jgi:DNA-directed RNA polymerase specialized sigma24 family protein